MSDDQVPSTESSLFPTEKPISKSVPIGLMEQLVGIFTEPITLFQKLRISPSWAWALGTMMVTSILLVVAWGLKVDVDAMLRPIMEADPRIPAERIDSIIQVQSRLMIPFSILGVLIMVPAMAALMALVYWLLGKRAAEDEPPTYLQAFSAATVPNLVIVPYMLLVALMCFLVTVGGMTPEKLSPTSVGYYLRPENPKLYALLAQTDLFVIGSFVMGFLAQRHLLRLKIWGAALGTLVAVLFLLLSKVLFAR